ncbi:SemiSWEET family transporter [Kordia jejudonensis]|uniref:SemiSWEET family transporter n=1 Tax=Kordia jejudonensis TaxID=1348245 RepID=UPI0021CDFC81|nr:SemiSWEET family transporter [Kordia jejudonensis]
MKTKRVNDVSLIMFVIHCKGVTLWIIYDIIKNDYPSIVTNGISTLLNTIMLLI